MRPRRDERGLTLMEVTIVMVLASLVMLALIGFYINSQAAWSDASSQAITQREMTAIAARFTDQAHGAAKAVVYDVDGPERQQVTFYDSRDHKLYGMTWSPRDSLVHVTDPRIVGEPAIGSSPVTRFRLVASDSLITLAELELRTATGKLTSLSTSAEMLNAEPR